MSRGLLVAVCLVTAACTTPAGDGTRSEPGEETAVGTEAPTADGSEVPAGSAGFTVSGQSGAYGEDDPANDQPACYLALEDASVDLLWALGDAGRVTPAPLKPPELVPPVAGVFLGVRPTGGYEVAVTDVRLEGDVAVLSVATREPAGGAGAIQMLTSPYALVALPGGATAARTEGSLELQCTSNFG